MNISDEIIFELKERGFIGGDLVKPDYRGFCISNIAPTISEFLGIKFEAGMPLQEMKIIKNAMKNRGISDHYDNIVLLFIDSINDGILNHLIDNSHLGKRKMIRGMLTSTFPTSIAPSYQTFQTWHASFYLHQTINICRILIRYRKILKLPQKIKNSGFIVKNQTFIIQ